MRKFWLIFAQSVTVSLAVLFAIQLFKPSLFGTLDTTQVIKQAENPPQRANANSFSAAAKKAMPSVVNIFTSKETPADNQPFTDDPLFRHFFGNQFDEQPQRENSLGSGVIVSSDGLILTNNHVVEAADDIEVALADGRTISARVVGLDPETDLAVLKVNAKNLPAITFVRSDQSKVGDIVLAIGNPFGVGQTVTMGIISAMGRNHLGINTFENFIQTDAPINPGNSGGALIDTEGSLVGINSAIYSKSGGSMGIGFAIPASLVKQVVEQIVRQGSVTRGWIGVEAQDITPELADSFKLKNIRGALISGVLRGGPADKAGIKPGDILLEIDSRPVTDSSSMLNLISALAPGHASKLTIMRNQVESRHSVTIGKRPRPEARRD